MQRLAHPSRHRLSVVEAVDTAVVLTALAGALSAATVLGWWRSRRRR